MNFLQHARKADSFAPISKHRNQMMQQRQSGDFAAASTTSRSGTPSRTVKLTAAALLGGVAHLAMFLGAGLAPAQANDACSLVSATYTCTGNQSGGIWIDGPETVLEVNSLDRDIVTSGAAGIGFNSAGAITANINTNGYAIRATGTTGNGITLWGYGDDEAISLEEVGDIYSTHGTGVWIDGFSSIDSHTTGNISAAADAIQAHSAYSGSVTVEHDGNLTSTGGYGVRADGQGKVDVDVSGTVQTYLDGIRATSAGTDADAAVTVEFAGSIVSSQGYGIYASSSFQSTKVTGNGSINSKKDGIFVFSGSDNEGADATVEQTGNVTSTAGEGIHVESSFHAASVTVTGNVSGKVNGIVVIASGDDSDSTANVDVTGNVSSTSGYGIYAVSALHQASVDIEGDINSGLDGVRVISTGSDDDATATIESNGNITSTGGRGLYARSDSSTASITSTGDIEAYGDAIYAASNGYSEASTATVNSTGDLISHHGSGIVVAAAYQAASAINRGDITAAVDGINVVTTGSALASIDSVGDITGTAGYGLFARSATGGVKIDSNGAITSGLDGIYAIATGGASDTSSDVEIDTTGDITSTSGYGIFAKSANHNVKVTNDGAIESKLDGIRAISTGDSEDADVEIDTTGDITSTSGNGIYAESTNHHVKVTSDGDIDAELDGIHAISTGDSEDADVEVYATGDIISEEGYGIFAKSANYKVNVTSDGAIQSKLDGIHVISTGDNADSDVEVDATGDITSTSGYGIYAESTNHHVKVTTDAAIESKLDGIHAISTGDSEDADVEVYATGDIISDEGYGVYATATDMGVQTTTIGDIQGSLGGIYASSTGSDGNAMVSITSTGNISTDEGAGIYGYASNQSVTISQTGDVTGGDYGIHAVADSSDVDVTFGENGVLSGAVDAAVYLEGHTGNSLTNYGEIDGGDGYAVKTKGNGSTLVENYGTLTGDIYIDDGYSTVSNMVDGTLNLGNITFTDGGLVENAGILSAGGIATVATSQITNGSYSQSEDGVLVVDIDGNDADLVNVDGTAELDGAVAINFVTVADFASYTLLTSSALDDEGISLERDGILATYVTSDSALRVVDGTDLVLDLVLNFAPTSLGDSESSVGQALQNIYENDDPEFALLLGQLANLQTQEQYEAALEELTPEIQVDDASAMSALSGQFTNKLFSCRVQDGAYRFTAEGECQWISISQARTVTDATDTSTALTTQQSNVATGGQWAIGKDLRFGVAAGYTASNSVDGTGATADGESGELGGVLKYTQDGVILGAALTGGWGSTNTERFVNIGLVDQTLTGSADSGYVDARLSAGYEVDMGDAYLKPLVNLDLKQSFYGGMTEAGGSAALEIADGSVFNAILSPSLELGGEIALDKGAVVRPFVRVGGTFSTGNELSVDANFVGDDTTFKLVSQSDDTATTLSAGLDFISDENTTVRFIYDGSFGDTTRTDSLTMKLSGKLY